MRKVCALFTLLFGYFSLYSQSTATAVSKSDSVYSTVDSMPKFLSGDLYKWIGDHVTYPQSAFERRAEGKVFVSFIVERNGSVSNVTLLRSVDTSLDREAQRLISTMPSWKPGILKGEIVRVKLMLPISFKISIQAVDTDAFKVFCDTCVDKQPEFIVDLRSYLRARMGWSREAARNSAQGNIVVSFIIEKDGDVTDIEIASCESGAELLKENALEVIDDMKTIDHKPKWTPAYKNGKPVRMKKLVTLDYNFGLYHNSSGH